MKIKILVFFSLLILSACNNSSKDSVEKADSTNKAILDSAINNNKIIVEEAGSSFLVRVADATMAEVKITSIAMKKTTYEPVKDFASMLHNDHNSLNNQVTVLAGRKKIVIPQSLSEEKQKDIDMIDNAEGKELDKIFLNMMISKHQNSIEMFEKAVQEVTDYDIKTFAEKTLPILKSHLEVAKSLQKKYQ